MAPVSLLVVRKAISCSLVERLHQHQQPPRQQPARPAAAASSVLGPRPRLVRRFAIAPVDVQMGHMFTSTVAEMTLAVTTTTSGVGIRPRKPGPNSPTCRLPSRTFKALVGMARYTSPAASMAGISPRTPSTISRRMRGVLARLYQRPKPERP